MSEEMCFNKQNCNQGVHFITYRHALLYAIILFTIINALNIIKWEFWKLKYSIVSWNEI